MGYPEAIDHNARFWPVPLIRGFAIKSESSLQGWSSALERCPVWLAIARVNAQPQNHLVWNDAPVVLAIFRAPNGKRATGFWRRSVVVRFTGRHDSPNISMVMGTRMYFQWWGRAFKPVDEFNATFFPWPHEVDSCSG